MKTKLLSLKLAGSFGVLPSGGRGRLVATRQMADQTRWSSTFFDNRYIGLRYRTTLGLGRAVFPIVLALCLSAWHAPAQGGPGYALSLDGTNDLVSTSLTVASPQAFTLSVWFNTTTTRGGRILGFGNSQSGTSTAYDRAIYMSDAGRVLFGVYSGAAVQFLSSAFSYNDGGWHQATATFSTTNGMKLYVDAQLVDANAGYNLAQVYNGFWRLGGDSLSGWPSQPTSSFFAGQLDEVQIWSRERFPAEIQADFHVLLTGTESGLTVLYHLDEGIATTSADAASADGANTASLLNGTAWVSSTAPVGLPSLALSGLTNILLQGATVLGTVNPNFQATTVYAQYGVTINLGSQSASVNAVTGGISVPVSVTLSGLQPGTRYFYRLVANSGGGIAYSATNNFVTLTNTIPTAMTLAASALTYSGATLNASVNPNNAPTTVYFQYGATTNYGSTSAVTNLSAATTTQPLAIAVSGSPASSWVNFRVVATNVAGTQFGMNQTFTTLTFSNLSLGPPSMTGCASAWGDFDNDGFLDLLLAGNPAPGGDERVTQIWRNLGNGSFTNIGAALPGVNGSYFTMPSVAWGDYDNDGRLDILVAGFTTFYGEGRICQIWRNTGNGIFTNSNITLPGISSGQAAWGDFDGDGRLDVIIAGNNGSIFEYNPIAQVWRNTGSGFVLINSGLPAVQNATVAVGDFDNDGFPDVAISGEGITQIWRNQGDATFVLAGTLPGRDLGSLAWVDADNDGFLDLLVTGLNPGVDYRCELYRNNGGNGTFTLQQTFTGIWGGDAQVGDYDNDGFMDVALQGAVGDRSGNPAGFIAQVWRNMGPYFTNIETSLQGGLQGRIAWGDYNKDGRLELTAGSITYGHTLPVTNTPPQPPTALSASVSGNSVLLSWAAGSDAQTPAAALSYNIRVGTTSGGFEVVSPNANTSTGFRRVPQMGNAQLGLTARVTRLVPGTTYYWAVQTVDGAYAGSPFAGEQTFLVPFAPTATTLPANGISSTSATLQGTVNPNRGSTTYYFNWGTTTNLGNFTVTNSAGAGSSALSVSAALSGLLPATTQYYQLIAANPGGTNVGAMLMFTSSVAAPYVTTLPATSITGIGATLPGIVDANGVSSAYYFRWGTTTNLGNFTVTNSAGSGSSTVSVSVALSGLVPQKVYYYQLIATNTLGANAGAMLSFTSSVAPPFATTLAATLISSTGVTLQGTVNPNGASTSYYFNWGTTKNLGNFTATNSAGFASNNVSVSAVLSGLEPATTYYYQVIAASIGGPTAGETLSFISSVAPPYVTTLPATLIGSTGSTLQGTLDPNGLSTSYYFRWGATTNLGNFTVTNSAGSGSSSVPVSVAVSGLLPSTTYFYQLVAANGLGTNAGAMLSFTSSVAGPYVITLPATLISSTGVTLPGAVDPNGASTTYYFNWGATKNLGNFTLTNSAGSGSSTVSVSVAVSGLLPDATYYYRLIAVNALGTNAGGMLSFTSSAAPPSATTLAATLISSTGSTLQGTANPNGNSTTYYYFSWGATTNLGNFTATNSAGTGSNNVSVSAALSGLLPATIYYYQLIASNSGGATAGAMLSFTTSVAAPYVETLGPTAITSSSGVMHASVASNGLASAYFFQYGLTTNYGGTTPVTSLQPHTALQLNGTNQFAQAGSINLANTSFTIEIWLRHSRSNSFDIAVFQGIGSANQGLHLGFRASNVFTFAFWGNDLDTSAPYTDTDWHHWACTYNTTNRVRLIYRDGLVVASNTASANYQGSGNFLWGYSPPIPSYFAGTIDEIRIWSGARTATQISAGMNTPASGTELGLKALWHLDEGTGSVAADVSANGFTATLSNAPVWVAGAPVLNQGSLPASFAVDAIISNLVANSVYHYRIGASSASGSTFGSDQFFRPVDTTPVNTPVSFTGFNGDAAIEPGGVSLQMHTGYGWFAAGMGGHADGLPMNTTFTSLANACGSNTLFQLAPANATNALKLGDGFATNASLALKVPAAYSSFSVLAASGNGGGLPDLTFQFADGSNYVVAWNALDWCVSCGNQRHLGLAAMDYLGRNSALGSAPGGTNYGSGFTYERNSDFGLYETKIDLAAAGFASNRLQSVSFNQAAAVSTVIFGMSGKLTSLPLSIVQQPATNHACVGDVASFSVGVDQPALASYQWQRNGPGQTNFISVAFATNSSYTTQTLTPFDDTALFRVIIAGPLNVVTSTPASLQVVLTSPASPLFSFDFSSLPTNATVYGSAFLDSTNGVLVLTSGATNQSGALLLADPAPGQFVRGFTATFKARIAPGTPVVGDGFSFNWATNIPNGTWPAAEEGLSNGLSIVFDIYDDGGNEAPAIDVKWNGAVIAHQLVSPNLLVTGTNFAQVFIRVYADDTLDVFYGCQAIYSRLALPPAVGAGLAGARFAFGARTRANTAIQAVDDFALEVSSVPYVPLAITQQPPGTVAFCAGAPAPFAVAVNDPSQVASYQWQRRAPDGTNFVNLPDATNSTCDTPPVTSADDLATYRVIVTGYFSSLTSTETQLRVPTVTSPSVSCGFSSAATNTAIYGRAYYDGASLTLEPYQGTGSFIVDDPAPGALVRGFTAAFQVAADTYGDGGYGFSFNWATNLPDAAFGEQGAGNGLTVAFYTLFGADSGFARMVVLWNGDELASVFLPYSDIARGYGGFNDLVIRLNADQTLDVLYRCQPVFVRLPVPATPVFGGRFGFGARSATYELWQIDNLAIQLDADFNPQLNITANPQDAGACPGGTAGFNVGVNYPILASYQWQRRAPGAFNFISITGATNATYLTAPLTIADVGAGYRVLVTGPANTATSVVAQVAFVVPSQGVPVVSLDFNSGPPANALLFGSAYVSAGTLELNTNATFQTGSFILNDPMPGQVVSNFTARFKIRVTPGTTPPADGFSFNWATDLPDAAFGEDGAGTGLTIGFDTYDNGGGNAPAVNVIWNGTNVAHRLVDIAQLVTGTNFTDVFIRLNPDATLDLVYGCQSIYARQPIPGLTGLTGARFGLGGRTGGLIETHTIDDFTLELGSSAVSLPLVIGTASRTGNGAFQILFTNSPGVSFSVLATTNVALPLANWLLLGAPTEIAPGSYEFIDSQTTNVLSKFYQVRSP